MLKQKKYLRFSFSLIAIFFSFPLSSSALEPISALDDGFAAPSQSTMPEAAFTWPGSEAFTEELFALLAWTAPFGIQDLAVTTAAVGGRFGRVGTFLSWSGTEFDLYGDDQEKFGASYLVTSSFSMGARVTRHALHISGFGNASVWSVDMGLVYHPVESLTLAAAVEDLSGATLGESREALDGHTRVGISWHIPKAVTFLATVSKVQRFDPSVSAGALIEITPALFAGVMGANEPDRIEFLAAVNVSNLCFSYRGAYHRELSFTHGFSLRWKGA